jgi:hypothetical protein
MLLLILFGLFTLSPQAVPQRVRFTGEVTKGQNFEREFQAGLLFRLATAKEDALGPGWTIEVRPKGETDLRVEYIWVVTGPYRGFNERYLMPSYGFSAKEIVSFNRAHDKSIRSN